uniref:Uncharacterized protein n=1 Tax=Plectus sambesii TaxID=2011161 RepID=A0A914UJE1_9BILA
MAEARSFDESLNLLPRRSRCRSSGASTAGVAGRTSALAESILRHDADHWSAVSFAATAASLSSSSTSRVEEDGEDGERKRVGRSGAPFELIELTELCELTLPLAGAVNVELPCHWLGP